MRFVALDLARRSAISFSMGVHSVALASLLAFLAGCSGCSNAEIPSPATSNETRMPAPPESRSASEEIRVGPGFRYDPDDRLPGYEEFVTIRLGNALRIFYRGEWRPATLALLDDQSNVLVSLRLDLPPVGAISGALPDTTPPFTQARLVHAANGLTIGNWERRIGLPEPELTVERINELDHEAQNLESNAASSVVTLSSHTATLDPSFGSIHIVACDAQEEAHSGADIVDSYTANFVANHKRSEDELVSDEAWLLRRVRDAFDELRPSSGPPKAVATE
jgi:hypothetical protein